LDSKDLQEKEIGVCCGDVYSDPIVIDLLDGIFHPGGLAMSRMMATQMKVSSDSRVLDVACGLGLTATYLAKTIGCRIAGIDAHEDMILMAQKRADEIGVADLTEFKIGLGGNIPYEDEVFTAAYSECALCTFYDKEAAVSEIARVLEPKGVFGLSDVTIEQRDTLDDELRGLIGRVACVADALSQNQYIDLFQQRGFELVELSRYTSLLLEMVKKVKGKALLNRDLAGNSDYASKMEKAVELTDSIEAQIEKKNIGYDVFIFQLE